MVTALVAVPVAEVDVVGGLGFGLGSWAKLTADLGISDSWGWLTPRNDPAPGEVQVKNIWITVDPYMRGRMVDRASYVPPFQLGEPMQGGAIGVSSLPMILISARFRKSARRRPRQNRHAPAAAKAAIT